METDTAFLERMEVIDYSVLLARYPISLCFTGKLIPAGAAMPSLCQNRTKRTLFVVLPVQMEDGFTNCVLDFFWKVKQLHLKIIKAAGAALPEQTITAEPERYREEFLRYAP